MNHFAGWNTALPRSILIIMPGLLCKGGNMQLTKALRKPQMLPVPPSEAVCSEVTHLFSVHGHDVFLFCFVFVFVF